jgi:alanyl-tRNA synthetase
VPIDEAKKMGAMALFGEKYGEFVRMVIFDQRFSVELCGGTHVNSTGQIGWFKIITESSIAAGVRRIEALTAQAAEDYVYERLDLISDLGEILKYPKDLKKSVEELVNEKNRLLKQVEAFEHQQVQVVKKSLLEKIDEAEGLNIIISKVTLPSVDALKKIAFELKNEVRNLVLVLAAEVNDKPQVAVMISDNLVGHKGLNANNLVRELAKEIQGGGGGQPFYATAGGKDISGIERLVEKAWFLIKGMNV